MTDALDYTITGEPIVLPTPSSLIAIQVTDASIYPDSCTIKILRTWEFIDWFTHIPGDPNSPGYITCQQLITVLDTFPPSIICPADITVQGVIGANNACNAMIVIPPPIVQDTCGTIDTFYNCLLYTSDAADE